jgi:hypothetical protein
VKGGVDWPEAFTNWADMEKWFLAFNRFLNKDSPILILMGVDNCRRENLDDLIPLDLRDEVCWIRLDVPLENLFGQRPSFALVRNKDTRNIKRIVFLSWHPHLCFPSSIRRQKCTERTTT